MKRWKIWLTAVLAACTLVTFAGQSVAGAGPLGPRVGVSAGSRVLWISDAERQAELNFIKASGAKWFTMDFDWASINPQRNVWNWAATDRVVKEARARDLEIVATLAYSPRWAVPADCPAGTTHCLPANIADFTRFAKAAVQRYGVTAPNVNLRGSVRTWQVWNEPNHVPFVQPKVNVMTYTALLKATYTAIKSVDMWTRVLAGGTSPAPDDPGGRDMSPLTFMRSIYYLGGKGYFDAFSHHPYSFPCSPLVEAPWNAFHQTAALYWTMAGAGDGAKKIWGTEAGAPTGAPVGTCAPNSPGVSVSEAVQAVYVHEYLYGWTVKFGAFTGPLIWFQIRNNGTNPLRADDNFGLLRRDFSAKPGFFTFQRLMTVG
jgi:hypothetical protein